VLSKEKFSFSVARLVVTVL